MFFLPIHLPNPKFLYFCAVIPRENGVMKKAHFSLYSALGELGHFTEDYAGIRGNDSLLVVYSYIHMILQVELIKFHICITTGVQAQPRGIWQR